MQNKVFNLCSNYSSVSKQKLDDELFGSKVNKITRSKRQSTNCQNIEPISNKKTMNKKIK